MASKRNDQFGSALKSAVVTVLVVLGMMPGARRTAQAASFSFTTIDVSFSDANNLTALGDINSNGQIVGVYDTISGASHAFIDDRGKFTIIDFTGAVVTVPTRLTPGGKIIIGFYIDSGGIQHGYRDDEGVFSTIDVPGATNTAALGIKPGGQIIVGFYIDSSGVSHGFLDDRGVFSTIDVPFSGATGTQLVAINPSGHIVGTYFDSSGVNHGFLDRHGVFTTIDVPFPGATFAGILNGIPVGGLNDINAGGEIAGIYFDSSGEAHGFLDDHGTFTKIDVPFPGTTFTALLANNSRDQLVGYYGDSSGAQQGFLATPNRDHK
jgi:probable HAF family extracellular repeat protein